MQMQIRRASERGHANHGWLDTRHTFSFASYWDPRFESFGPLRVLNEDRVHGGTGFGRHGHSNAEIFSYIVNGSLEHRDSMGNREVLRRGDVQFTCAGSGIRHSEMNAHPTEPVHFLQIWVLPEKQRLSPSYATKHFTTEAKHNKLCLLVSKKGHNGSIKIHQDISTFATLLDDGASIRHKFKKGRAGYVHVVDVKGSNGVTLNEDTKLLPGDGAFVQDVSELNIVGHAQEHLHAELLLFDLKQPEDRAHM